MSGRLWCALGWHRVVVVQHHIIEGVPAVEWGWTSRHCGRCGVGVAR